MAVPTVWTDEMIETLRRMREAGSDASDIARALGLSRWVVVNQMDREGLAVGRLWAAQKATARHAFADRLPQMERRRGRVRYA